MTETDQLKRAAAMRAAEWIRDGMVVGLGTGSTAYYLLEEIATRRSQGLWKEVVGVPTSEKTTALARHLGIPLVTLAERPNPDIAIDGADEVDADLNVTKGLGGALLREKVVATVAGVVLIVVDESKRVPHLGTKAPVPVEVDPFSAPIQEPFFRALGSEARMRVDSGGSPFITDGGHYLFDCHFAEGIAEAAAMEVRLNDHPGVLENGLFIDLADFVIVGTRGGVEVDSRGDRWP